MCGLLTPETLRAIQTAGPDLTPAWTTLQAEVATTLADAAETWHTTGDAG
ncbi:MAG: hypothetical protein ABEJ57_01335 [Halobacteriaceae archaeon]